MAYKVKFKNRLKEMGVALAAPKPVFDPDSVPTPKPKRKLKPFSEKDRYELLLEYREGIGKPFKYQRLGFKSGGGLIGAIEEATRIAVSFGKALAVDLHEIRNEQLCRVLGVYVEGSFKDWSNEPYNNTGARAAKEMQERVKKTLEFKGKPIKPKTFMKEGPIKVR